MPTIILQTPITTQELYEPTSFVSEDELRQRYPFKVVKDSEVALFDIKNFQRVMNNTDGFQIQDGQSYFLAIGSGMIHWLFVALIVLLAEEKIKQLVENKQQQRKAREEYQQRVEVIRSRLPVLEKQRLQLQKALQQKGIIFHLICYQLLIVWLQIELKFYD